MADELVVKHGVNDLVDQWLGPGTNKEEPDALFESGARDARGRPIKPKPELTAVQKKLKRKIDEGKAPVASRRAAEESDEEKEESRAASIVRKPAPAIHKGKNYLEKSKKEEKKNAAPVAAREEAEASALEGSDDAPTGDAQQQVSAYARGAPAAQPVSRSHLRKITGRKTRSKQKNRKKDNRPPAERPNFGKE